MKPSELLADPTHWTQGALARDIQGQRLSIANAPTAVCWCLIGALNFCGINKLETYLKLESIGIRDVVDFNDTPGRTHAEVLEALVKAGL